ncbi:MAG: hypothetical protein NTW15_01445 [Burkholderiales bacterium]|nr:hypothetical protein [Burkholderiales bacterium]
MLRELLGGVLKSGPVLPALLGVGLAAFDLLLPRPVNRSEVGLLKAERRADQFVGDLRSEVGVARALSRLSTGLFANDISVARLGTELTGLENAIARGDSIAARRHFRTIAKAMAFNPSATNAGVAAVDREIARLTRVTAPRLPAPARPSASGTAQGASNSSRDALGAGRQAARARSPAPKPVTHRLPALGGSSAAAPPQPARLERESQITHTRSTGTRTEVERRAIEQREEALKNALRIVYERIRTLFPGGPSVAQLAREVYRERPELQAVGLSEDAFVSQVKAPGPLAGGDGGGRVRASAGGVQASGSGGGSGGSAFGKFSLKVQVDRESVRSHLRRYLAWSAGSKADRGEPPPVGADLKRDGIDEAMMQLALDGDVRAQRAVVASLGKARLIDILGKAAPDPQFNAREWVEKWLNTYSEVLGGKPESYLASVLYDDFLSRAMLSDLLRPDPAQELLGKIHTNPRHERYVTERFEERLAQVLAENPNANESEKTEITRLAMQITRQELDPRIIRLPLQRLIENPDLANQMRMELNLATQSLNERLAQFLAENPNANESEKDLASRAYTVASRISAVDVMRAYMIYENFDLGEVIAALEKIDSNFSTEFKSKKPNKIQAAIRFITAGSLSPIDPILVNIFAGDYARYPRDLGNRIP